jgi:hypothetical protein
MNRKQLVATSTDFYYMAINFLTFSTNAMSQEAVFMKMDYNPRLSGIHMCHKWNDITLVSPTFATTSHTTVMVAADRIQAYLFDYKGFVALENGLIRNQQVHPFQTSTPPFIPRRDS